MGKGTKIISDLRSFFSKSENNKAIDSIMSVMDRIHIRPSQIGPVKKDNCKMSNWQILQLLMQFPFFSVKNASKFPNSALGKLFVCEKDMFYRFINDGNVNWRTILWSISGHLIRQIEKFSNASSKRPRCLILDDTDAPKRGKKTEFIGRIYSHVVHKSILGFKCLTLLYTDGISQSFVDFSLHGEEGKNADKKQGLTKEERNARMSNDYSGKAVEERSKEYFMKKTDKAIEMVKMAILKGYRFDYLLMDSWFTNSKFVRLITSRHIPCHLLGMIKLGNTTYETRFGRLNATQIIKRLQKEGLCKYSQVLRCTYCTIDVKYAGTTVRLFLCKRGRKGSWNGLLTTDLSLKFLNAYRIYSMRWSTEVAYHDCKTLLNMGKCQSRYFSAQIASFTLTMIQYNILSAVKRFESYETIGGLFNDVIGGTLEMSVVDRIWELVKEVVLEIAEVVSADAEELLSAIVEENPKFHKFYVPYNINAA